MGWNSEATPCNKCVQNSCGGCASRRTCLNGTVGGPSGDEKCLLGWVYGDDNFCPNCARRSSCADCYTDPNCVFCGNSDNCVDLTPNLGQCQPKLSNACACHMRESCSECQADTDQSCFWCPEKRRCFAAGESVPSVCSSTTVTTCPVCSSTNNCQHCGQMDGCAWCGGQCQEETKCPVNSIVPNCDEYCKTLTECEPCIFAEGCNWCAKLGRCEGADVNHLQPCGGLYAHTCPGVGGSSFDAGSFFGGMALVLGLAGGAALGIFGYKYYRRRSAYSVV